MEGRKSLSDASDIFRDLDEMHKEMNGMFNIFNDISTANALKDLIREYENSEEDNEIGTGPIVYGYSMTIGPDGKPHVREFRIGKSSASVNKNIGQFIGDDIDKPPQISTERESKPVVTTADKVKVVLEMPGINEEDIKLNTYGKKIEIKTAGTSHRKYYKIVNLPPEADAKTARFTYNNGILEVIIDKKRDIKTKEKDAFIHLRNILSNILHTILDFRNKLNKQK
jgi:HSP20 family protein